MPYEDNQTYAKYLKKKCLEEGHHHEHGGCDDCNQGCDDKECSCCPPGLVSSYDDKGNHIGCLTPNDAELLHESTFTCNDGYVKLYKEGTPAVFLGCVSEDKFAELYSSVNPA